MQSSEANEAVACVAESILAKGPLGHTIRGNDYEAFLDRTFGYGRQLRDDATSCAIFVGACLIEAGVKAPRKPPDIRGITSWIGIGWFGSEPSWIPADKLEEPLRGDVPYWCSSAGKLGDYVWTTWTLAANGHVGVLINGAGPIWFTAEGGGRPGGYTARLSENPKNIMTHNKRTFRGVWRPGLMIND